MNYDEIFTFENLYQAHLRARRGRRSKKDVIEFEINLSQNLWALRYALKNRTYKVSGYHKFTIYEPKKREIQALAYKDRIVQHALCDNYLYPLLTRHYIYDNCACQKGKGTDFAYDRLSDFLRRFYRQYGTDGYILKADIHHFFPSVDHAVLNQKLKKVIDEPEIYKMLCGIVDSFHQQPGKGLPMGNQTSQLFALFTGSPDKREIADKVLCALYGRLCFDFA